MKHINSALKTQHTKSITRNQFATGLAVLIYVTGFTGLLFFKNNLFIRATPVNMALMFVLLIYTQKKITAGFCLFIVACVAIGFTTALIGIKTGILFGNYKYGAILGPAIENVPIILGINWFIVIYCAGITIQMLLNRIVERISVARDELPTALRALSVVVDGTILVLLFVWIMEPAVTKLGYWSWIANGTPPIYNYVYWFTLSIMSLLVFHYSRFEKHNKFAVHLLLIQAMFFLLVRTFL